MSGLDSIYLHLEEVLAVFLYVRCSLALARHLAHLANRHEGAVEAQGQRGTEEETAGIEANDDIGQGAKGVPDLELEDLQEGFEDLGVLEDGQDVDEVDTGGGPVREVTQGGDDALLGLFAVCLRRA